ncbi:type II toxin-antitoxin system VapC family toxin [Blastomonas fulva]|uniref:type II toxin-antitoxin system VapC family toxin n=1 Tax=Blastomonas fulva TaxID=1550728 RepID=UPI0025A43E54|nr:type II toxin-antitoxin system VapC family toxin [Blastomonas fulva]MDM7929709.1 type II toxin-antitoxin system VapC family toxin [Blastomonas fulva]MDM7965575.1 type II toxin-antitoxin system VapC family toxin [Blastomonas fulva]
MRLMLDTHILLWWLQDNPRLGAPARALIADSANQVLVSLATPWEISVKQRVGKMDDSGAAITEALLDQGIAMVDLKPAHLRVLEAMPLHHRDPFDHLIIAQALAERAAVITDDAKFPDYGVRCIPA